jgi:hypothetical protein
MSHDPHSRPLPHLRRRSPDDGHVPREAQLFKLLGGWALGERNPMAGLAVGGLCLFVLLNMVAIQVALA